jgi:mannose-6-phosphate isomerase-like protein (cupin superfamily)
MKERPENAVVAGQGEQFLLGGAELITFKLRGREYSVFENATRAGYGGPPPHRHFRQDEGFYVVEGQFTFYLEGRAIPISAGHFINIRKGSVHTFQTTGVGIGRLLVVVVPPGDFEAFVEELGERVNMTTPPVPPTAPPMPQC